MLLANALMLLVFATSGSETKEDYKGCATSLSVLEDALYETSDNKLRLNAYFFPPRQESVPFAKVVYTFQNTSDNCSVTYVWAIGGFLLIQPPSIFTYSSLLFFHWRRSGDFTLRLTLPHECQPLVEDDNGTCSCAKEKTSKPLDLLTQQLRLYAQYRSPTRVEVGTNVLTQAECYDNLERDYFRSIKTTVYLSYCFCLPIILITTLVVVVRSMRSQITTKLSHGHNHPGVAGLVLTGIFVHLFCLAMDMAAVRSMYIGRELEDIPTSTNIHRSLNFIVTGVTLAIDVFISVLLVICSVYLHCQHILEPNSFVFKHVFQRALSPLFYVVFGEFDQGDYWRSIYTVTERRTDKDNKRIREHTAWVVCFMLLAPLFSLASHVGYIFAAWLTEPSHTTSAALIFLGVTAFLFVVLRQCYVTNERVKVDGICCNCLLLCYPFFQVIKCACNCICLCVRVPQERGNILEVENGENDADNGNNRRATERQNQAQVLESVEDILRWEASHFFNTRAFCIAFAWGWPLVASVAFFLAAFYELPVASYTLPLYLLNAFQVFIVIITLLITYKMLQITEPVLHVFLRSMRDAYTNRARHLNVPEESKVKMEGDEVVSTATLMGELAEVIVHELQKSPLTVPASDRNKGEVPAAPDGEETVQHITLTEEEDWLVIHGQNSMVTEGASETTGPDPVPIQGAGPPSLQSATVSQHATEIDSQAESSLKKRQEPDQHLSGRTPTETPGLPEIYKRRRYTESAGGISSPRGPNSSPHSPARMSADSDETTPLLKSV